MDELSSSSTGFVLADGFVCGVIACAAATRNRGRSPLQLPRLLLMMHVVSLLRLCVEGAGCGLDLVIWIGWDSLLWVIK